MKFLIMSFALSASWISSFQTPAVQQLRTGHTPLPMHSVQLLINADA
jgi:hypothetical protein